jgi:hypothetical protein
MEPRLALTYNSQMGNGNLGVGWSLSRLSLIHRCGRTIAQDGLNAGINYDNDDRYCLDGQRLVMISTSGTYGGEGVEYRTERESFTKVVSNGTAGNGAAWFKVWTKAGLVMEYGHDEPTDYHSRIEAADKPTVRVWALNKVSDTKGNYLTVTYAEDNVNGDYRPMRIDYTGNTAVGPAPYASVQFTYEDRTDITPMYVGGSVTKIQKRLINVKTYLGVIPVKDYRIAYIYSPNNGPSLVTSISECSGDGTSCLPAHSFVPWQTGTGSNNLADPVNWGGPISPGTKTLLADINGDGLADLVYGTTWSSGLPSIIVHFATGTGFGGPIAVGSADATFDPETGGYGFSPIAVGDVNGDGRADVMTVSAAGAGNVRLSTGNSLAGPVNWGGPFWPATQTLLADVNGDGFADMVYGTTVFTGSPNVVAHFSNGGGFVGPVIAGSADATYDPEWGSWGFSPIAIGDVNGDGRADVMTVSAAGSGNVRVAQTRTPDLITTFTNSLGASATVTYKPLTDTTVYAKDTNAIWPVRDLLQQGPLYVTLSTSLTNGIGGNYVTNYFYTGAKAQMQGGGFLGFRLMRVTDPTGIKTTTTSRQDYPFQGPPISVVKTQSNGAVLNQVTNSWTDNPAVNSLTYNFSTGKYHRSDLTQAVQVSNDLNGAALPTVTTTMSYDAYGNTTGVTASTGDGYSKATTNAYEPPDTVNWFLGRLTRGTVTSVTP